MSKQTTTPMSSRPPDRDAKRDRLRAALGSVGPSIAIGAHDAMSARLVEDHDFDAVWVSGFGVSTMQRAIPDMNLLTMSEMFEASCAVDASTSLPVLVDCDNGYGGVLNVIRTVRDFERAGIAGICIEDNTFPKANSLFGGAKVRALLQADEQAFRLAQASDEVRGTGFVIVARVEALIAGLGPEEAIARAEKYAEAGADALLIHANAKSTEDLLDIAETWCDNYDVPLVVVPTLFAHMTSEELAKRGFALVIYANHLMRAAIPAMQRALAQLVDADRADALDEWICKVGDIFDLVGFEQSLRLQERSALSTGS